MGTAGEVAGVRQWVCDLFDKKDRSSIFKVLLVGDCVGKSSLLLRFCTDEFVEESSMQFIPMTIGLDVKSKTIDVDGPDGKEPVTLTIWDTAGQDRFRKMNEQYLPSADAVILLYDVRNAHTFKECRLFMDDIGKLCDSNVVKVLVGNKDDFDDNKKVVCTERGRDVALSSGYEFVETSAKDNRNIHELFYMVAKLCLDRNTSAENSPS